ncbi:Aminoglycoside N(6')-acetyltransferase type 1 [compost metagenome]
MPEIIIRRAGLSDLEHLSELFVDFIGKGSNIHRMEQQLKTIQQDANYYVAVADDGRKVVGTAMGIICHDLVGECGTFMVAENVVVAPETQGRGVGKRLMESLEDFGRSRGCKYVILVSEIERAGSHAFYGAIGYTDDQKGFKKKLL